MRNRPRQSAAAAALRYRFARNLRLFRTRQGMTQDQLASAAGLGRTFISQVEQGRFSVTLETVGALSSALGVCPTILIQVAD